MLSLTPYASSRRDALHTGHVLSRVRLFVTPGTVACRPPLSMGFSRREYWSGVAIPPPGDLPHPGIELASPASPALTGGLFTTQPRGRPAFHTAPWLNLCETSTSSYSPTSSMISSQATSVCSDFASPWVLYSTYNL